MSLILLNKKRYHQSTGFTLIELVVYVALVAALVVAVVASLLAVSRTSRELSARHSLQAEGLAVMDRLAREIRIATSTNPSSVFSTSPGVLSLQSAGLDGDASGSTVISVDGDNLVIKVGSTATTSLTANTAVESLIFRNITNDSVRAIRIELTLGSQSDSVDKTISFFNTIIMRSSYGQ